MSTLIIALYLLGASVFVLVGLMLMYIGAIKPTEQHPQSPEVRTLRFRQGLCLHGLGMTLWMLFLVITVASFLVP